MKKILLPLGMSFFLFACNNNSKTDPGKNSPGNQPDVNTTRPRGASKIARFEIAAAKVVFNVDDPGGTGTETFYFDGYGERAVLIVDKSNRYGRTHTTTIWNDNKGWILDHEKKTATKISFRPKSTEPPTLADADEATRRSIGYEKIAGETVAGKNCEVWQNTKQDYTYWLWNKIDLKQKLGKMFREATRVEEITAIPPVEMDIPSGYQQ